MKRESRAIVSVVVILASLVALLFGRFTYELIRGVRISATLDRLGPADVEKVPQLVAQLGDSNPMIRQAAAGALARMGPAAQAAKPALLRCLQGDPSAPVRSNAACALGWLRKDPELISPLIQALDDQDGEVRRYAAYALSMIGPISSPAVPKLIELLEDPHMAYMAARALGAIGAPARPSIPQLIKALRRDNSLARMEFIIALGKFGPEAKQAIPDLFVLANDADPRVKKVAGDTLPQIDPQMSKQSVERPTAVDLKGP
jgi:HEAT repeat protein